MVAGDDSSGHPLGFAAWIEHRPLEADLAARSDAALKDTVLDKTQIAVDGRDVTLCRGCVLGRRPQKRPCSGRRGARRAAGQR